MIVPIYAHPTHTGFFGGQMDGIVTTNGEPSACPIYCLDVLTLQVVAKTVSLPNGRYWLNNLDPKKSYLLMARDNYRLIDTDNKSQAVRDFEPFCYDDVTPASNLSWGEQVAMWESWISELNNG